LALGFDPEHHEAGDAGTRRPGTAEATARLDAALARIAAASRGGSGRGVAEADSAAADVVDREVLRVVAVRLDDIIGRVRGLLGGAAAGSDRSGADHSFADHAGADHADLADGGQAHARSE
jgi:hypothetical protein